MIWLEDLSPTLISFIAGLAASVGVNLITSIIGGDGSLHNTVNLVVVSVPWLIAAGFLTRAALLIERARGDIDRGRSPSMSQKELVELRTSVFGQVAAAVRRALVIAAVLSGLALVAIIVIFGMKRTPGASTGAATVLRAHPVNSPRHGVPARP